MVIIRPTLITNAVTACQRVKAGKRNLEIFDNAHLHDPGGSKGQAKTTGVL